VANEIKKEKNQFEFKPNMNRTEKNTNENHYLQNLGGERSKVR
jgi:hypothetical protein